MLLMACMSCRAGVTVPDPVVTRADLGETCQSSTDCTQSLKCVQGRCELSASGVYRAGECAVENPTIIERDEKGCVTTRYSAVVTHLWKGEEYQVKGQEIRCDRARLGTWEASLSAVFSSCNETLLVEESEGGCECGGGEPEYTETIYQIVSRLKHFASVDELFLLETGDPGTRLRGVIRRTFDTRTGKPASLKDIYPDRYARMLVRAKKAYRQERDKRKSRVRWDPLGFSVDRKGVHFRLSNVAYGADGQIIEFSLPQHGPR